MIFYKLYIKWFQSLETLLRKVADLRNITDILAEEQDFKNELSRSSCVVLTGTRHASSLIQNQRQKTEDDLITFDGKVIHDEFTGNKELLDRLVIVFFTERTKNDWVPIGPFATKRNQPATDEIPRYLRHNCIVMV